MLFSLYSVYGLITTVRQQIAKWLGWVVGCYEASTGDGCHAYGS